MSRVHVPLAVSSRFPVGSHKVTNRSGGVIAFVIAVVTAMLQRRITYGFPDYRRAIYLRRHLFSARWVAIRHSEVVRGRDRFSFLSLASPASKTPEQRRRVAIPKGRA